MRPDRPARITISAHCSRSRKPRTGHRADCGDDALAAGRRACAVWAPSRVKYVIRVAGLPTRAGSQLPAEILDGRQAEVSSGPPSKTCAPGDHAASACCIRSSGSKATTNPAQPCRARVNRPVPAASSTATAQRSVGAAVRPRTAGRQEPVIGRFGLWLAEGTDHSDMHTAGAMLPRSWQRTEPDGRISRPRPVSRLPLVTQPGWATRQLKPPR